MADCATVVEGEAPRQRVMGLRWRLEYVLLAGVVALMVGFAIAFFLFGADVGDLRTYGYPGLFAINLMGSASIFLPSPAGASVVGGGALLSDVLGLPSFLWVGLVAGSGEAIGEFSGYAAGYGGRVVIEKQPQYERVNGWMQRNGVLTLFLLSIIPNPVFDVAGIAAGAVRMPVRRFFSAVLAGKIIKDFWLAAIGAFGADALIFLLG